MIIRISYVFNLLVPLTCMWCLVTFNQLTPVISEWCASERQLVGQCVIRRQAGFPCIYIVALVSGIMLDDTRSSWAQHRGGQVWGLLGHCREVEGVLGTCWAQQSKGGGGCRDIIVREGSYVDFMCCNSVTA